MLAANSTNGPPPEATKEGGVAGDPLGAIRALGGTSDNDFKPDTNKVEVPKLGGAGSRPQGPPPAARKGR